MTTHEDEGLPLAALIPAADLSRMRRRIAFLEAALAQVLRDERQVREWFGAAELAALHLPGLPATASGIARQAKRERWEARITRGRTGERVAYHFSALPRAAFAELLSRVVRPEEGPDGLPDVAELPEALPALAPPQAAPAPPIAGNATPAWVLPLLRHLRGGAASLDGAVAALSTTLPKNQVPTLAEARETLRSLGIMTG